MCVVLPWEASALDDGCSHGLERVDALFCFEIRYSSEALCLQAATWSPVPVLLLHNLSVLLVRVFIVPTFPQLLTILKGAVLICFCQGVFTVICSTPGLTVLFQDLPSRTGQKVDFLSQEDRKSVV